MGTQKKKPQKQKLHIVRSYSKVTKVYSNISIKKSSENDFISLPAFNIMSVNLQFDTVGRRDYDMIVPLSDGPMIIWIDWE